MIKDKKKQRSRLFRTAALSYAVAFFLGLAVYLIVEARAMGYITSNLPHLYFAGQIICTGLGFCGLVAGLRYERVAIIAFSWAVVVAEVATLALWTAGQMSNASFYYGFAFVPLFAATLAVFIAGLMRKVFELRHGRAKKLLPRWLLSLAGFFTGIK